MTGNFGPATAARSARPVPTPPYRQLIDKLVTFNFFEVKQSHDCYYIKAYLQGGGHLMYYRIYTHHYLSINISNTFL